MNADDVNCEDPLLQCKSCFRDFIHDAGEARHFYRVGMRENGVPWPAPSPCKRCREAKKGRRLLSNAPHSNDWRRVETRSDGA
jgi:hypothetical protein